MVVGRPKGYTPRPTAEAYNKFILTALQEESQHSHHLNSINYFHFYWYTTQVNLMLSKLRFHTLATLNSHVYEDPQLAGSCKQL